MSVIIMHPKHNLEMKYKRGVEGRGVVLSFGSCCKAECGIPDHDVMKMYFLWEHIHFTLSSNDLKCRTNSFHSLISYYDTVRDDNKIKLGSLINIYE